MQTTQQVAQQAVQGLLSRMDALAQKMGTTANYLWQVYLAQAKVEGIRDLIMGGCSLGIGIVLLIWSPRFFRLGCLRNKMNDGSGWWALSIITTLAGIAGVAASLICLSNAIPELLNPAYWAFQHLTVDLKNLL